MKTCSQCGATVVSDAKFCATCGVGLTQTAAEPEVPRGFFQAGAICFRKTFDFKSRASRREFWLGGFAIFLAAFVVAAAYLAPAFFAWTTILPGFSFAEEPTDAQILAFLFCVFGWIPVGAFLLAAAFSAFSLAVRRLRDVASRRER